MTFNQIPGQRQTLDDIVFENRNKEYGSYWLRKRFFGRLAIGFAISLVFFVGLSLSYFLYLNTDFNDAVYPYPVGNPYLKSTEGSLLSSEELGSLMAENRDMPQKPLEEIQPQTDVLRNFTVTDQPEKVTFRDTDNKEKHAEPAELNAGFENDTIFGGFLLGDGHQSGPGNELDRLPEFPGGMDAVRRFIELEVNYPAQAVKQKIHGVVIISFEIGKSGEVNNIKVEKGLNPMLDNEAARAITEMPRWKPGLRHGKPVIVRYMIPVRFMPLS